MITFDAIYDIAYKRALSLGNKYIKLLELEQKEIKKQGAEQYWIDLIKSKKKFKTNKNALVLPYLLKITPIDPFSFGDTILDRLQGILNADKDQGVYKDNDMPDIDMDFTPNIKDAIKQYAMDKYGEDKVCSVGLWQTYKFKSSLRDVAKALTHKDKLLEIEKLTKILPDELDVNSIDEINKEYPEFKEWYELCNENKNIAEFAFKLVGKIKAHGQHAGGLIISDRPIYEHIPIAKIGSKGKEKWTSEWTEGKNVQLSKFGFVKYDILGLKTLQYIQEATELVKRNHNILIDWDKINYDDQTVFKTANELKTDSIFQLDTDIAKSILSKGGVKSLTDILVYISLGRPGPMPMIDEYIKRRDAAIDDWKKYEHFKVLELLKDTYGIIVFQEQVTSILTELSGFTIPEAEHARKIMSKKWKDKMIWVKSKVLDGLSKSLSGHCPLSPPEINIDDKESVQSMEEINEICKTKEWTWAKEYWKRLETFARYSFNKCLSEDTMLTNPVTNESILIKELYNNKKPFKLLSCHDNQFVIDDVVDIHYNGSQLIYEVEFDNGIMQHVTIGHKFMNKYGVMETLNDLMSSQNELMCLGDNSRLTICKIRNIKQIGFKHTYSIEMSSEQHNYITSPNTGQPIHANSHAVSYAIQCYKCLYLKTYYPTEWWCAVLNSCDSKKQPKYIRVAKSEKVEFGSLDINNLSIQFDVRNNQIIPGLIGIKGIGPKMLQKININIRDIKDVDDFIERQMNSKILMERIIHLGAFDKIHPNTKALWYWYLYKYGKNETAHDIREKINEYFVKLSKLCPPKQDKMYITIGNRKFVRKPDKYIYPTREKVMELIKDYTPEEKLEFQQKFLDYYIDSPLDLYEHRDDCDIDGAKIHGVLECVVLNISERKTVRGDRYLILNVNDGLNDTVINIWDKDINKYIDILKVGAGLHVRVVYKHKYHSFNLDKSVPNAITKLPKLDELEKLRAQMSDTEIFPEDNNDDD